MKYSRFVPAGSQKTVCSGRFIFGSAEEGPELEKDDAFALRVEASGEAVLFARGERARKFAAAEAGRLGGKELLPGTYVYEPEFGVRGIIEGFYGRPWSMDERRRVLALLAEHGMNEYFYGPKDDPFHRDRWDELYGENDAYTLRELIGIAAENCMEFRYMLAPGLSIRYSSRADREKLYAKYRQVMSFGVRKFGLLLDDLEKAELYPEDAEKYPRQVDAHIELVNDVFAYIKSLDPDAGLIVCPTQYWGGLDQDYIVSLGRGIPEECEMFFTGPYICSDELTAAEAEGFFASTGHRAVWWDNYPVNDAEMVDELHILPLRGREAALGNASRGLVANPMELAETSLVPLLTVADCLWNSGAYDPEESWNAALSEVCGNTAENVAALGKFCYKSCLSRDGHHFEFVRHEGRNPEFDSALAAGGGALENYLEKCGALFAGLLDSGTKIASECERWIRTAKEFCDAGTELLRTGDGGRMKKYLCRDEDVMKREACKMLDIFVK